MYIHLSNGVLLGKCMLWQNYFYFHKQMKEILFYKNWNYRILECWYRSNEAGRYNTHALGSQPQTLKETYTKKIDSDSHDYHIDSNLWPPLIIIIDVVINVIVTVITKIFLKCLYVYLWRHARLSVLFTKKIMMDKYWSLLI